MVQFIPRPRFGLRLYTNSSLQNICPHYFQHMVHDLNYKQGTVIDRFDVLELNVASVMSSLTAAGS